MKKYYVIFNPLSCNGLGEKEAHRLDAIYGEENLVYRDITRIEDYRYFFAEIPLESEIVLCGGDGTLNEVAAGAAGYFRGGRGGDGYKQSGETCRDQKQNGAFFHTFVLL